MRITDIEARRRMARGGNMFSGYLPLAVWLVALGAIWLWPVAHGLAAPANDRCGGAFVIPSAGPFPYLTPVVDITDATGEEDPPAPTCLSANASRSIWYTFTPAESGTYLLSVCDDAPTATTVVDTIMAIYAAPNGCGGPLTQIPNGCNDDACGASGLQSSLNIWLETGVDYQVVVWQFDDAPPVLGSNSLQLAVRKLARVENDTCADASPVVLGQVVTGSTVGASNNFELSGSSCFGGIGQRPSAAEGADVVYAFTAPAAGRYYIRASGYSLLNDLVLYVMGSCPEGPFPTIVTDCLAAANRSSLSSAEAVVCLEIAAQHQVYIVVDDGLAADGGSPFQLEVTLCLTETEPNNDHTNANPWSVGLVGAIQDFGDVDYFTLGVPPAGSRLFAALDGEAANLPDLDLRVVTVTNTLEYDDDNNDSSLGDTAPNVAGTILDGDPVFLRVSFNNFFSRAEPYSLYAVVQPPLAEATPEIEPNGTPAQAQSAQNNYFSGTLTGPAPSLDLDVYQFHANAGDLVFLGLDGDPLRDSSPIDARLELLDETGAALAAANDGTFQSVTNRVPGSVDAPHPNSPGEAVVYRVPNSGFYYARVSMGSSSPNSEGAGDYLLSISRNCVAGGSGTNQLPQLQNVSVISPVVKGQATTLSANLVDADLGQTPTVTVDWGDGSASAVLRLWGGEPGFSLNHVYLQEPPGPDGSSYLISITVADNLGGTTSVGAPVVVYRVRPAEFLSVQHESGGSMRLQLQGAPATSYEIWTSPDLSGWSFLTNRTADAEGRFEVIDASEPLPATRFYRALAP